MTTRKTPEVPGVKIPGIPELEFEQRLSKRNLSPPGTVDITVFIEDDPDEFPYEYAIPERTRAEIKESIRRKCGKSEANESITWDDLSTEHIEYLHLKANDTFNQYDIPDKFIAMRVKPSDISEQVFVDEILSQITKSDRYQYFYTHQGLRLVGKI